MVGTSIVVIIGIGIREGRILSVLRNRQDEGFGIYDLPLKGQGLIHGLDFERGLIPCLYGAGCDLVAAAFGELIPFFG